MRFLGLIALAFSAWAQTLPVIPAPGANGTITAPTATDLTLNGGSSGASIVVGKGADGRVVITPGTTVSGGYEYATVNSSTASGSLGGDSFGLRSLFTVNATTVGYHSAGFLGELLIPSGNSLGATQYLAGIYGYLRHDGSGTHSEGNGVISVINTNGSGSITEANAFKSVIGQDAGAGRMVSARHFYAPPFTNAAASTKPTTLYGLLIGDQGVDGGLATTVCAVCTLGNTPSTFAGAVTVGALNTGGVITSSNVTNSGSVTTGAIINPGGIGIAKDAYIGGILNLGTTGSALSQNGIQFGSSTEGITRVSSGQFKWLGGGALTLEMDAKPGTTATYDIGTSSVRWRQLYTSGIASIGSLGVQTGGTNLVTAQATTATMRLYNSGTYGWSSTSASDSGSYDTCLGRVSSGLVEITNCTVNTWRDMMQRATYYGGSGATTSAYLTNFGMALMTRTGAGGSPTVSQLTACSASGQGAWTFVTDSNTSTYGATVAAGGANKVMIWCNGTNWTVMGQ